MCGCICAIQVFVAGLCVCRVAHAWALVVMPGVRVQGVKKMSFAPFRRCCCRMGVCLGFHTRVTCVVYLHLCWQVGV